MPAILDKENFPRWFGDEADRACALPVRYAGCKSNRQAFRIAPKRWSTKALRRWGKPRRRATPGT
jgi:hypothetical protein